MAADRRKPRIAFSCIEEESKSSDFEPSIISNGEGYCFSSNN